MAIINPYINFNGNAEEAFNFYKSVFGGEFTTIARFKDLPNLEHATGKDADQRTRHYPTVCAESFYIS